MCVCACVHVCVVVCKQWACVCVCVRVCVTRSPLVRHLVSALTSTQGQIRTRRAQSLQVTSSVDFTLTLFYFWNVGVYQYAVDIYRIYSENRGGNFEQAQASPAARPTAFVGIISCLLS